MQIELTAAFQIPEQNDFQMEKRPETAREYPMQTFLCPCQQGFRFPWTNRIEAIELGSLLVIDAAVCADGAEKPGGERRIDAFEQFEKDEADRVSLRQQSIAAGAGKLGNLCLISLLKDVVLQWRRYSPCWCDKQAKRCRAQPHAVRHKAAVIPMARMTCALWLIMIFLQLPNLTE